MNTAQKLLLSFGFDSMQLIAHLKGKNPTFRKKGPGRKHSQGRKSKD